MKIKKNAENIDGMTDVKCCRLDWEILKYVIPAVILVIALIYIWFKTKLGGIIKIKD